MEKKLNLVFDDWGDDKQEPNNNNNKMFGEKYSRNIHNLMGFFDYKNYKLCKIEDIEKYPEQNFYYLVWCIVGFDYVTTKYNIQLDKKIIKLIKKNKNFKILFINEQESEGISLIKKIDIATKLKNINQSQIYIINNNVKLQDIKNFIGTEINVHSSKSLSLLLKRFIIEQNITINYIKEKHNPSLFVCHNNNIKEHRISLLILLSKFNIIDDVDWSLINGMESNSLSTNLNIIKNEKFKQHVNYFENISGKVSKFEGDTVFENNKIEWTSNIFIATFENSYFNIVTETFFSDKDIHITEKSFKPFCFYQFPIFLSEHHHLKYMRMDYDFDYFDDIIDHSYDNIVDDRERIFKVVEEIKRIQENKDFFIDFYKKNKDRFIENNKKYMALTNEYDINFLNSLI